MHQCESIDVTAAIIIEDGKVLITRRAPGGRHPGAWEFPGGKVEPGETAAGCLARELAEELEIEVVVGEKLAVVHHVYPDLVVDLLAFECRITGGRPRDICCSEHAWVGPRELGRYNLLPADRKVAEVIILGSQGDGRFQG